MDLKELQKYDESARDMYEPISGCLNRVIGFMVAVFICAVICALAECLWS